MTEVRVTGDFFLEPPKSVTALGALLEGHPTGVSRAMLIEAIQLPDTLSASDFLTRRERRDFLATSKMNSEPVQQALEGILLERHDERDD